MRILITLHLLAASVFTVMAALAFRLALLLPPWAGATVGLLLYAVALAGVGLLSRDSDSYL